MALIVSKIIQPAKIPGIGIFHNVIMIGLGLTIIGIPLAIGYAMVVYLFVAPRTWTKFENQYLLEGVELFRRFIGHDVEHLNVTSALSEKMLSVSGIAYKQGYFYLLNNGSATKVSFEMIRDYSWSIAGVTKHTIVGAGPLHGTSWEERMLDDKSALQAYKESGLTINVKDITYPTWFIMTNSQSVCDKWTEILRQVEAGTM